MTISTLIIILIIAVIINILFTRHVAKNVDDNLKILTKQTDILKYVKKRGTYHNDLLEFIIDNVNITIEFAYNYGSKEERAKIVKMLDKYKVKPDEKEIVKS